jgi:hypothetical protein
MLTSKSQELESNSNMNVFIKKDLSLHHIFILICQQKWQEIIVNNISNISKDQWLAVRLHEESEPYYWDLVSRNLLPYDMVYWIENECMNVYGV